MAPNQRVSKPLGSLLLLSLIGLLFLLLYWLTPLLGEQLILSQLEANGYQVNALDLDFVHHDEIRLNDIHLLKQQSEGHVIEIYIPTIKITYSLTSLLQGKLRTLSIQHLRIFVRQPEPGITLPDWQTLFHHLNINIPAHFAAVHDFQVFVSQEPSSQYHLQYEGELRLRPHWHKSTHLHLVLNQHYPNHIQAELVGTFRISPDRLNVHLKPKSRLVITDISLLRGTLSNLETESLSGDIYFKKNKDDTIHGNVALTLQTKPCHFQHKKTQNIFGTASLNLAIDWQPVPDTFETRGTLRLSHAQFPDLHINLTPLTLEIRQFKKPNAPLLTLATFSSDRLQILSPNEFNLPLKIKGRLQSNEDRLAGHVALWEQAHGFRGKANFQHEFKKERGTLSAFLQNSSFNDRPLTLNTVLPQLEHPIDLQQGHLKLATELHWALSPDKPYYQLQHKVHVSADGLGGHLQDWQFRDLTTQLALTNLKPLTSEKTQYLTMGELKRKVTFRDFDVLYHLKPSSIGTQWQVEQGSMTFAGGRIMTQDFIYPASINKQRIHFTLNDYAVKSLLQLINLPGLSGSGLLAGEAMVSVAQGQYQAVHFSLHNTLGGGILRYQPPEVKPSLKQNKGAQTVLKVMNQFHYNAFNLAVDYRADHAQMKAMLAGKNPHWYNGIPLKFNLNFDAPLALLLNKGFIGEQVRGTINHQVLQARAVEKSS